MSFARRNYMPPPPNQPKWLAEHGPGYRPPHWVAELVDIGVLQDNSWRNDSAASFTLFGRERDLVIWVEHEDPEERESSEWTQNMGFIGAGPRYALHLLTHEPSDVQGHGRQIEDVQIWAGDSPEELRDQFFRARFEMGL